MNKLDWVPSARVLIEDSLNVRRGEDVLVVADTTTIEVAELLAYLAAARGAQVVVTVMAPTPRQYAEPPRQVAAAMLTADVIMGATKYSLLHTKARRDASAAGGRFISLAGANASLFTEGSLDIDIFEIAKQVRAIGEVLTAGKELRITSSAGTDIAFGLIGRPSVDQTGICHEPGTWGVLPALETAVAPAEGTAKGMLVVDGLVAQIGKMVTDPIRVTFENGQIVLIEGSADADEFREYLRAYDDPALYHAVEIGIGMNPNAQMSRSYLESEAEYGTMHVGIGDGASFGSSNSASTHVDLVICRPTLEVDGKLVLADRQFFPA